MTLLYKKKIFVIGGAGFIGSNFLNIKVPEYSDYFFINIDALTYAGSLNNLTVEDFANYRFEKVDIRNLSELELLFKKYEPTDVINFAAESHVDASILSPHIFIETNVLGAHNLLFLSKQFGVRRFHQISTDEVYGALSMSEPSFREDTPLSPTSPYSASKAAADHIVLSYHKTFGLNTVITRCSNNFGPRQDKTKFMPKFIISLLSGEKAPLYAKGENVRDWIYVDDHVEAIDKAFHFGKSGEIYNVGGNTEKTNLEIARTLLGLAGKDESYIEYVKDRPGHDFRYAIDSAKIKKELGWEPRISFEEGVRKTWKYYKDKTVV
ncbi:MAG: dTDP-glucose 4,6-dehydratase [bacterium]|nr:dTDP-glucose 4,6-dehydratase [bacterium]